MVKSKKDTPMGSGMFPVMDTLEAKELMEVALGKRKADLAIVNTRVVNVYTGEILDNCTIAVKGKRIAYVGEDLNDNLGEGTLILDAEGRTVIPGLIDGHSHLVPLFDSYEFVRHALPGGTTAVIAETMEALPVGGLEGMLDFMESYSRQPLKVFFTAASLVSISRTLSGISLETLRKLLGREDILGLGESYWQGVLQDPDKFFPLYEEALRCGKTVEGHSAGASGRKLAAYVAAGIGSCHESITAEEALERLRLGLYVMVREGSIRRELETICRLKDAPVDLRRLIVVTDGIDPKDILDKGYMEFLVQKAINCGLEPLEAVRMATLNVAEHFSLDGSLGGIAPGKYADLVIIPDLKTIRPEYVISNGKLVAEKGTLLVEPRRHIFAGTSLRTINLPLKLSATDFVIQAPVQTGAIKVRVIDQVTDLVTKELHLDMPVIAGEIKVDLRRDIVKVAAIDRTQHPGRRFVGLLHGFHMQAGAFSTSATWDTSDIVAVGVDDADLALAVNRIRDLQGGTVVCARGRILAEFPLPILGLISNQPMEKLKEKMEEIEDAVKTLGVPFVNPFLTLITLTGAAIPYFRICEEGLVNLKEGRTLGLIVQ